MLHTNLSLRKSDDFEIPYLVKFFEQFYAEIISQKQAVHNNQTLAAVDRQAINEKLVTVLQRQAHESQRLGGVYTSQFFQETQFISAALADEIFLNMDWDGRSYWEDHLIEAAFFGSHDAGDLFFDHLEHFLSQRDYHRTDVAQIYLMALGLGFQGKYRGQDDQGKIARYRQQLYHFIYHQEPRLYQGRARIFPNSYMHTLEYQIPKTMQDKRLWHTIFLTVLLIMLLVSHIMWNQAVNDIETLTLSIINTYDYS